MMRLKNLRRRGRRVRVLGRIERTLIISIIIEEEVSIIIIRTLQLPNLQRVPPLQNRPCQAEAKGNSTEAHEQQEDRVNVCIMLSLPAWLTAPISSWVSPIQMCSAPLPMLEIKVMFPPYLCPTTTSSSPVIISVKPPIQKPTTPINKSISHLSSGYRSRV